MPPIRRVAPSRWMHLNLIAVCLVALVSAVDVRAENPVLVDQTDLTFEPYSIYVAVPKAYARCGPADDYYRTDPLRQGQELEVYAETDDGWLGIRPPKESFCWVPAETVEKNSDQASGVIIEDRTVAWIGTHLGRARTYRWQVQLAAGEPVTVIGKSEREGPDGPQLWYRIVPPSGEYRWIHRDQIVNSSEELVALMRGDAPQDNIKVFPRDRPAENERAVTASRPDPSGKADNPADAEQGVGESILARDTLSAAQDVSENTAVGSGLADDWRASDHQHRTNSVISLSSSNQNSVSSISNIGRPRLVDINSTPAAPDANQQPVDSSWVAATAPERGRNSNLGTPASLLAPTPVPAYGILPARGFGNPHPAESVMTASAQQVLPNRVIPAAKKLTYVSTQRLNQIENETRQADIEQLGLIFSRLMASRATAAEAAPVARAAYSLAGSASDPLVAGRARMLSERVEQYRQVAHRRDGEVVLRNHGLPAVSNNSNYPVLPAAHVTPTVPASNAGPLYQGSAQSEATKLVNATGYLVQVYSARTNSPPFALTDNSGRTIAYVTPIPGVNLRPHLNHRVSVFGNRGFLTGLGTPHLLATQAVRSQP